MFLDIRGTPTEYFVLVDGVGRAAPRLICAPAQLAELLQTAHSLFPKTRGVDVELMADLSILDGVPVLVDQTVWDARELIRVITVRARSDAAAGCRKTEATLECKCSPRKAVPLADQHGFSPRKTFSDGRTSRSRFKLETETFYGAHKSGRTSPAAPTRVGRNSDSDGNSDGGGFESDEDTTLMDQDTAEISSSPTDMPFDGWDSISVVNRARADPGDDSTFEEQPIQLTEDPSRSNSTDFEHAASAPESACEGIATSAAPGPARVRVKFAKAAVSAPVPIAKPERFMVRVEHGGDSQQFRVHSETTASKVIRSACKIWEDLELSDKEYELRLVRDGVPDRVCGSDERVAEAGAVHGSVFLLQVAPLTAPSSASPSASAARAWRPGKSDTARNLFGIWLVGDRKARGLPALDTKGFGEAWDSLPGEDKRRFQEDEARKKAEKKAAEHT